MYAVEAFNIDGDQVHYREVSGWRAAQDLAHRYRRERGIHEVTICYLSYSE